MFSQTVYKLKSKLVKNYPTQFRTSFNHSAMTKFKTLLINSDTFNICHGCHLPSVLTAKKATVKYAKSEY